MSLRIVENVQLRKDDFAWASPGSGPKTLSTCLNVINTGTQFSIEIYVQQASIRTVKCKHTASERSDRVHSIRQTVRKVENVLQSPMYGISLTYQAKYQTQKYFHTNPLYQMYLVNVDNSFESKEKRKYNEKNVN